MKKKISIGFLIGFLVGVSAWGLYWMHSQFRKEQAELIELMKTREEFDGETVDRLWRFKEENGVSDEYMELYNRKIKHLPGWRP